MLKNVKTIGELPVRETLGARTLNNTPKQAVTRYLEDAVQRPGKPIEVDGTRLGRNDRCPCGSGLKVKKCHLHVYKHED